MLKTKSKRIDNKVYTLESRYILREQFLIYYTIQFASHVTCLVLRNTYVYLFILNYIFFLFKPINIIFNNYILFTGKWLKIMID